MICEKCQDSCLIPYYNGITKIEGYYYYCTFYLCLRCGHTFIQKDKLKHIGGIICE